MHLTTTRMLANKESTSASNVSQLRANDRSPLRTLLPKTIRTLAFLTTSPSLVSFAAVALALAASGVWIGCQYKIIYLLERDWNLPLVATLVISSIFMVLGLTLGMVLAQTKTNRELERQVKARTAQIRQANQQLLREVLEHQQVREELRKSQQLYRTLVNNAPNGSAILVVRELTEQKQAKDKIRALNERLEQRVAERTRDLQATNQELEAFCYSVSHDLRAPLRRIDSFSRILLEDYQDVLDAGGKYYLQRVSQSTERMEQMIDDLLALSRLTLSEMHVEVVDLSAIAHAIARELQQGDRSRQVTFAIAPNVTARGDTRFLKILLENLLGNAWKYTGKRSPARIEFGVASANAEDLEDAPNWRSPGKRDRLVYFVRDNGAGFDMTYASKLFSPFQRLHNAKEFEGTGIGLAIVQRILRRHNGSVWAEAAVELGATFYFCLPE